MSFQFKQFCQTNFGNMQILNDDKNPMPVSMDGQKIGKNTNSRRKDIQENVVRIGDGRQEKGHCSPIYVDFDDQSTDRDGENGPQKWTKNDKLGGVDDFINPLLIDEENDNTMFRPAAKSKNRSPFFGKFRFCIALLLALATYSYTSMRMNLSMAMVCMVNSTAVHIKENGHILANNQSKSSFSMPKTLLNDEKCPKRESRQNDDISKQMGYRGTLEWSTAEQAQLFGATFYGSFFTVWFSGYLADRFGAKLLISLAIADYSLVSLFSPLFVSINYNVFFAARIFMGFGEGFVMPTLASASARWFPPGERSLMVAICTLGNQFAALSALLLSSRLCALEIFDGWPTIFYTFGLMGMLCLALWSIFASNNPEESRWIGEKEQKMITASLGQKCKKTNGPIPWRQMAKSLPLYAGILGQSNYTFCNIILQSYLPTFFKEVVQLNLRNNGFFSVIPFVGMICSKIIFGSLADSLIKRKILISPTNTAKLFQGIANFGAAIAALCIGIFVGCGTNGLAAIFMALWGISYGANASGFLTQLISIGPRFSGTISSVSTAMAIITSGISPIVVSTIVRHGTLEEWQQIWFVIAACNLFCAIFFIFFASAKVQQWAMEQNGNGNEPIQIEIRSPKLEKIVH